MDIASNAKKELNKMDHKVRSKLMTKKGEEGKLTKAIEEQTEKLPSGLFLTAGVGAIATSLALKAFGMNKSANFIGLWVPTILVLGLYNKIVKLEGSERDERSPSRSEADQDLRYN